MNLSPQWVAVFRNEGWDALHWSGVGDPRASDSVVLQWAGSNGCCLFTHDLDFGALLAAARAASPSVVQIRADVPLPEHVGELVISSLRALEREIDAGALITIEPQRARIRLLPIVP